MQKRGPSTANESVRQSEIALIAAMLLGRYYSAPARAFHTIARRNRYSDPMSSFHKVGERLMKPDIRPMHTGS